MLPNPFLKNRSGIYGIRSLDTGKIYVGRTKCMFQRGKQYVNAFHVDSSKHLNDYLRAAFNKYGLDRFELFPLEFCSVADCVDREIEWMDKLGSCDKSTGYNLRRDSDGGMIAHARTKSKISKRLKAEWASGKRDAHAQKMRDKWSGDQRRKDSQSAMLSRIKTKWKYRIVHPDGTVENDMFFARLKELGLTGVQANFKRNKADTANCKGFVVTRIPANLPKHDSSLPLQQAVKSNLEGTGYEDQS